MTLTLAQIRDWSTKVNALLEAAYDASTAVTTAHVRRHLNQKIGNRKAVVKLETEAAWNERQYAVACDEVCRMVAADNLEDVHRILIDVQMGFENANSLYAQWRKTLHLIATLEATDGFTEEMTRDRAFEKADQLQREYQTQLEILSGLMVTDTGIGQL